MKYVFAIYNVELYDKRYLILPTEKTTLRLREERKSLKTQYQRHNITQFRKNQKVIETNNELVVVKTYPKN